LYNKEIDFEKDIPDIIPMFYLPETWPITDAKRREIFSISVIVEEKRGFHGSLQYYKK